MKKLLLFWQIIIAIIFASCSDKNGANNEITIYGNVIDRTTGHPLYNVLIQEKNKVGGSTVTGNDGNYEFTLPLNGSSNGTYYIVASKEKYSSSEYELVLNSVDKNRSIRVDFQLSKEAITYVGTVLDSQNNPIADAKVSAQYYRYSWNDIGSTVTTDANGSFLLELPKPNDLSQWRYAITVSKNGYTDATKEVNQHVDDMGKTITLNFVLKSAEESNKEQQITVSGKVNNYRGYAVPNAYITVYVYENNVKGDYIGSVMTNQSGQYSISFFPVEGVWTYYFNVSHEDYRTETKTLELSSYDDVGKTFTLDYYGLYP